MSLREQKKQNTRRALADAAVRLFSEHGYDSVTMDDVAAEVGVSRRTAFRYFPTKGDLVMEYPAEWRAVFDRSLSEHAALSLFERLRAASNAVAAHIESDPVAVRQLFGLAFSNPALTARYASSNQEWIGHIAEEISTELASTTEAVVQANILAAALMGMINSVCELWATGDEAMGPMLTVGFELLAASFEAVAADR